MDARLGVVTEDAIRCLIISHHLLDTNEIVLIHHTPCGMLAFTDDLLKAGLEGDRAAEKLLGQATAAFGQSRPPSSPKPISSASPARKLSVEQSLTAATWALRSAT